MLLPLPLASWVITGLDVDAVGAAETGAGTTGATLVGLGTGGAVEASGKAEEA